MGLIAGSYHDRTSYERSKMGGHYLDWRNQPEVFKVYEGLSSVSMPRGMPLPREDFFSLYDDPKDNTSFSGGYDLELLSKILLLTYTLTAKTSHSGGAFYYRSAASAGALYPTEIYVHAKGITNLDDGLYHFSIPEHRLVKLREGDFSSAAAGFMHEKPFGDLPLIFFLTTIFFRSAWKYRDRSYRYHLLDTGHVLENLNLAMKALKLSFDLTFDFDDRGVNRFLGLDDKREGALAVCRVNGTSDSLGSTGATIVTDLSDEVKKASRVAPMEFTVPEINRIHTAGYEMVSGKSDLKMCGELGVTAILKAPVPSERGTDEPLLYPEAVFKRRSSRNFVNGVFPASSFQALLRAIHAKGLGDADRALQNVCIGFLTGSVESLEDGFYLMDENGEDMGLVKTGTFIEVMSHICLDQTWLARASLHILFICNVEKLEREWGPRGYRYAMMAAGMMGERLYLAASALGLGCCGIGAFYDGEASGLLNLEGSSRVLYVVSLGAVKSMPERGFGV